MRLLRKQSYIILALVLLCHNNFIYCNAAPCKTANDINPPTCELKDLKNKVLIDICKRVGYHHPPKPTRKQLLFAADACLLVNADRLDSMEPKEKEDNQKLVAEAIGEAIENNKLNKSLYLDYLDMMKEDQSFVSKTRHDRISYLLSKHGIDDVEAKATMRTFLLANLEEDDVSNKVLEEQAKIFGMKPEKIAKLPKWSSNKQFTGLKEGHRKLFQKDGIMVISKWNAERKSWYKPIELTESHNKDGVGGIDAVDFVRKSMQYDHVIRLQIHLREGGVILIGYNNGDDPFDIAEAVIEKYMLDWKDFDRLVDSIQQYIGEGYPSSYIVSGAGSKHINGIYYLFRQSNGEIWYRKQIPITEPDPEWAGKKLTLMRSKKKSWWLTEAKYQHKNIDYYNNPTSGDLLLPSPSGWRKCGNCKGVDPPPTVYPAWPHNTPLFMFLHFINRHLSVLSPEDLVRIGGYIPQHRVVKSFIQVMILRIVMSIALLHCVTSGAVTGVISMFKKKKKAMKAPRVSPLLSCHQPKKKKTVYVKLFASKNLNGKQGRRLNGIVAKSGVQYIELEKKTGQPTVMYKIEASNGVIYVPVHIEGSEEAIEKAVVLIQEAVGTENMDEEIELPPTKPKQASASPKRKSTTTSKVSSSAPPKIPKKKKSTGSSLPSTIWSTAFVSCQLMRSITINYIGKGAVITGAVLFPALWCMVYWKLDCTLLNLDMKRLYCNFDRSLDMTTYVSMSWLLIGGAFVLVLQAIAYCISLVNNYTGISKYTIIIVGMMLFSVTLFAIEYYYDCIDSFDVCCALVLGVISLLWEQIWKQGMIRRPFEFYQMNKIDQTIYVKSSHSKNIVQARKKKEMIKKSGVDGIQIKTTEASGGYIAVNFAGSRRSVREAIRLTQEAVGTEHVCTTEPSDNTPVPVQESAASTESRNTLPNISKSQMQQATNQLTNMTPEQLKQQAAMLKSMSYDQLRATNPQMANMTDSQIQMSIQQLEMMANNPVMVKMAADQMKNMNEDDFENMRKSLDSNTMPAGQDSSISNGTTANIGNAPVPPNLTSNMTPNHNAEVPIESKTAASADVSNASEPLGTGGDRSGTPELLQRETIDNKGNNLTEEASTTESPPATAEQEKEDKVPSEIGIDSSQDMTTRETITEASMSSLNDRSNISKAYSNFTTLNEDDPLLIFLRSQESCIKGSVDEFYTWLVKSEDIDSMLALKEAVNEDDYLNDMKVGDGGGSGVKGFKRKAFLRAISEYFNDKSDAKPDDDESKSKAPLTTNLNEPPEELVCPISLNLMTNDPVLAADSITYERASIEDWFEKSKAKISEAEENLKLNPHSEADKRIVNNGICSPVYGSKLESLVVTPNTSVRNMARAYKEKMPIG